MDALREWLTALQLESYYDSFREQRIDLDILSDLSEPDLAQLGIPLGDRKRLLRGIKALRDRGLPITAEIGTQVAPLPRGRREQDEELRQLTLLFSDLVGSTALSKTLDLEGYRDTIRTYQLCCSDVIRSHFGFVAQFLGDGVMAYFGYPTAEEDDAERAVSAGLNIAREVARLRTPANRTLSTRVGVATGEVLISDLVSERLSIRGAVLGDTPNLAARLQTMAEPGQVLISDQTHRLLGNHFDCVSLGIRELKGFAEPQEVWRAIGVEASASRFIARRRGPMTPFVGREEELEILRSRWRTATQGDGRIVLISGEAGIGKSRLGEWLGDAIAGEPHYRLNYQCSPYHTGSPLYPVMMQLAHAAGFAEGDSDEKRLDKLERLLAQATDDVSEVAPLFAQLLSIPSEHRYGPLEGTPEAIREQTAEALIKQVIGLASRHPVLVFFEDLHWIDPSTAEVLDMFVERLSDHRILLVCTYRPEYESPWIGRAGVSHLSIARLDRRASIAMVERLADGGELPPELVQQIVDKTEGVPLFIEELTKTVLERRQVAGNALTERLALPATLKDLLMAKLDSLSSAREVVPLCAAIGRSFPYRLLLAVNQMTDQALQPILDQLTNSQILLQRGVWPEVTLTFRHALIQDAAYSTMLASRARALHKRIAETLIDRFPEITSARPEVVAQHFARAGRPLDARRYFTAAARLAIGHSANIEACVHIQAALAQNALLDPGEETMLAEIELRELLREPIELCGWGSSEIEENLARLYELRGAQGDAREQFSLLVGRCGGQMLDGRIGRATEFARQMSEVAERTGDPVHAVLAAHHRAMCRFMSGRLTEAIESFEAEIGMISEELLPGIREHYIADLRIVARAMQAWARVLTGANGEATRRMAEVRRLVERSDQPFSQIYGLAILASIHQTRDQSGPARKLSERALTLAREHHVPYWEAWSMIVRGWARVAEQAETDGIQMIRDGLQKYAGTGARQLLPYGRTILADALARLGQHDEALRLIEELEAEEATNEVRYFDCERGRIAERLRENGEPEEP